MIRSMPGGENRFQSCTVDAELVSVIDRYLTIVGSVLVDYRLRGELQEVRDAPNMVVVTVRNERLLDDRGLLLEHRLQRFDPDGDALRRIDK